MLLKLVALRLAAVAPDGAHVEHAVAELDEGAALDRDVDVCSRSNNGRWTTGMECTEHSAAELDEGAALDGDVDVCGRWKDRKKGYTLGVD